VRSRSFARRRKRVAESNHRTDARSITTTIAYDALNRPTSKSYNDSPQTPTVSYFYDGQSLPSGAPSYDRGSSTGRLVAVTYGGASAGTYRGYDAMGRVIRQYQQTDSVNYLVEASYYANSSLQNETYPSVPGAGDRRVVSYTNDSAGRLASLNSNATTYAPAASVSSIGYASHNALNTETYGNSLIHAVTYNNRLQANEIKLGTSGAPTSVIDLTYSYGTTNNNGNLQSITYTGGGLSYTQSFGYDALNRLTTSNENSGSSWSQTNGYDQYGNRWIDYGGGIHNLSFSTSTNRITTSGFTYDSSGNLTNDGAHAYSFDAENKINKVDNASAYVYDGEGQRVRKLLGENLRFVYDMHGKQIAEFDGSTGNLKKEYIYGSSLITIEPTAVNSNGTQYLTSDHLGSPRVVTNSSAGVVSRHDYLPFGEELGATIGGRTTGMGYSVADGLRQKFTQKERDNETGLDYFGARYYASTQGRFTSSDAFWKDSQVGEPQSWNKYSYVRNNPLRYVDPQGEKADVEIVTDEKHKTGTIKIKASIAIYAGSGTKISQKDLERAKGEIKKSIEGAWSGTVKKDGITFTVTTQVDVQVASSQEAATNSGAQNVIEMVNGPFMTPQGQAIGEVEGHLWGPDTGKFDIGSLGTNMPQHEFGHLLGVGDRYEGDYLMNTLSPLPGKMFAGPEDMQWTFGGEIKSHRDASRPLNPVPLGILNRAPAARGYGDPTSYTSVRELRAARIWWN